MGASSSISASEPAASRFGRCNWSCCRRASSVSARLGGGHPAASSVSCAVGAEVRCARVETLHLAESEFDHVLVLRSYNHLSDPGAVLRRLCASIRPGGSLLVVDNVAFGLVRSRVQADRGEGGPAGFEHFFNHDSHQAARSIPHDMVELIDHLAVDPAGSNQWLLHYRRRDHVR